MLTNKLLKGKCVLWYQGGYSSCRESCVFL